jgi:hypothetical protein
MNILEPSDNFDLKTRTLRFEPACARFHNLFSGGNSSSASTSSNSVTGTGTSKVTSGSTGSTQGGDNGITVGSEGAYLESGAANLEGNSGTINISDGGKSLIDLAGQFAQATQNIASDASQSNIASNSQFLAGLQQLAQGQQSGGLSSVMQTFLWLALGGMALLAITFRKR